MKSLYLVSAVLFFVFSNCDGPAVSPPDPRDIPPIEITDIEISSDTVQVGNDVRITVTLSNPNLPNLNYNWRFRDSLRFNTSTNVIDYGAGLAPGRVDGIVVVSDTLDSQKLPGSASFIFWVELAPKLLSANLPH